MSPPSIARRPREVDGGVIAPGEDRWEIGSAHCRHDPVGNPGEQRPKVRGITDGWCLRGMVRLVRELEQRVGMAGADAPDTLDVQRGIHRIGRGVRQRDDLDKKAMGRRPCQERVEVVESRGGRQLEEMLRHRKDAHDGEALRRCPRQVRVHVAPASGRLHLEQPERGHASPVEHRPISPDEPAIYDTKRAGRNRCRGLGLGIGRWWCSATRSITARSKDQNRRRKGDGDAQTPCSTGASLWLLRFSRDARKRNFTYGATCFTAETFIWHGLRQVGHFSSLIASRWAWLIARK